MGWKWKDSFSGAVNGAKAGSMGGPVGTAVGAVAGGVLGGFSKDIDKKVTGNSQSGLVQGGLGLAGTVGSFGGSGGFDLPKGAGITSGSGFDGIGSVNSSGFGSSTGSQDYSKIFDMFQRFQNRNPADTSSEFYDPQDHAGLIKSRYPFIPDQAFQNWLRNNSSGIQMGSPLRG